MASSNFYIILGLLLIFIVCASVVAFAVHQLSRKLIEQEAQLSATSNEVNDLHRNMQEYAALIDKLAAEVDHMRTNTENRQTQSSVSATPYQHAIQLAKNGNDVGALMDSCGLSRTEATLIVTLHSQPSVA